MALTFPTELNIAAIAGRQLEGNGDFTVYTYAVSRSGPAAGVSTVRWAVSALPGSTISPADFGLSAFPSGTLTFAAGQTLRTLTIRVVGDAVAESDEAFAVTLSTPTGAKLDATAFRAQSTVVNDDTVLAITPLVATQGEGNSGSTPYTVVIARAGLTTGVSTVRWAVSGTGLNPAKAADFVGGVLPTGTLTFAAGETSRTLTVNVNGDTSLEANETFIVSLSSPSGATLNAKASTSTGIVTNDDTVLSLAPLALTKAEGQPNGTTPLSFTVSRKGSTSGLSTALWSVEGVGSHPATADDFAGNSLPTGTVSFAAGQLTQTLTIQVAGDAAVEPSETFKLSLSSPTGATLEANASSAAVTISNDDSLLAIEALTPSRNEGTGGATPFTFRINRTGDAQGNGTVRWAVSGSGAAPATGADFTAKVLPSGTLSFAAGETSRTLEVTVAGDMAVEPNETFSVSLFQPSIGSTLHPVASTATVTISNDDTALAVTSLTPVQPEGNTGSTPWTFQISRTGLTTGRSTVAWAVGGGGTNPANAADFTGGSFPTGTVTFAPGQTTQTVALSIAGDAVFESEESFALTLSSPTGARLNPALSRATATIANDDTGLSIAPLSASKAEGQSGSTPFTFSVFRTGITTGSSTVRWSVSGTGANPITTADLVGGTFPSGMVTFAAGQTSQVITVAVAGDTHLERDQSFAVTLSSPTGGSLRTASATGTVANDDTGQEWAAQSTTRGVINPNDALASRIDFRNDEDWFKVNAKPGDYFYVSAAAKASYPIVDVVTGQKTVVSKILFNDANKAQSMMALMPVDGSPLYVRSRMQIGLTGDYELTLHNLGSASEIKAEVLRLANDQRRKAGVDSLKADTLLNRAAQGHADDLARTRRKLSHVGSDGSDLPTRLKRVDYSYSRASENVADWYYSPADVMLGWMGSEGHRKNLLNPDLEDLGVGFAVIPDSGKTYWVQDFGTRLS